MRKKISVSTAVTLLLLTAALTISITMLLALRYFNNQVKSVSQRQAMYTHVNTVDKTVRDYYSELNEEQLRQGITEGYIEGLGDPYAAYFTPEEYVAEKLRLSGKANNIGLEVCYNADSQLTVCKVHTDSAAHKAGVKVGDVITAIDGEAPGNTTVKALQDYLNAAAKVLVSVQRSGEASALAFDLSAFQYTVRTVETTVLGDVGYVKVTAFYENTPGQFRSKVETLMEEGVTGIVFDLRDNQGGLREAAQEVISYMVPLGMYGTVSDAHGTVTNLSSGAGTQVSLSTVTLVNDRTAGEAEFFAGVLQEFSLTTVVGVTTAGKAQIQDYFTLEVDNSAMKLTVAEYGLLKSGSWQGVGIVPTLELPLPENQAAIYRLLTPEEDIQVQASVAQISTVGPTAGTTTTTTTTAATTNNTTAATKAE